MRGLQRIFGSLTAERWPEPFSKESSSHWTRPLQAPSHIQRIARAAEDGLVRAKPGITKIPDLATAAAQLLPPLPVCGAEPMHPKASNPDNPSSPN